MKVLVASHSYSGNGAAVMLLAVLAHWIRDLGWTVDVLLELERDVPDDLASIGANIFNTAVPEDYDFALVNTIVSAHLLKMLGSRVRTVLWAHEGETVLWNSPMSATQWRDLFRLPKRIIFQGPWQSETVFRSFIFGLPSGTVSCVRNGVPAIPENLVARPRTKGKARVVFVGGVYGRKRPQDLIDAVLALGRDDLECLFVGPVDSIDTIGSEHVEKIRSRPDCFQLLGELDRKRGLEYVLTADVFCLPSSDESQPIAPLEAASLGVPCLLSDLPPYGGTWKHGDNCLLSRVGDIAQLQRNLLAVLENTSVRNRVIAGGRDLAAEYSMATFFSRFDAEMPT
jgi:glycosyltransferase involved in cell wall biosynthesis